MGRPARRALLAGHGTVLAAFESALYLESNAGIACIVPMSAPPGPLNVNQPGLETGTPSLQGATWRIAGTTLAIDGLGTSTISPYQEWTPLRVPTAPTATIVAGVASMGAELTARVLHGEVIVNALESMAVRPRVRVPGVPARPPVRIPPASPRRNPLGARFARAIPALSRWLDGALVGPNAPAPRPVIDLLGLGGGLTPSGDDCLVGVLVALHAFGARGAAESVARIVARHAPHRTSRLSAAHLDAACAGEAIEPVHSAIEAIAFNASPEPAIDGLERYGHASGYDALAGVLLAASAIAHNRVSVGREART